MSKDSLAKYYQNSKENLRKKLVKDIKVFEKKPTTRNLPKSTRRSTKNLRKS